MPVIRYPDGTEVRVDEPEEPPAHLRRGRFDKRRDPNQTERQRLEAGLGRMFKAFKSFLLDDEQDDVAVAARMIDNATKDDGPGK